MPPVLPALLLLLGTGPAPEPPPRFYVIPNGAPPTREGHERGPREVPRPLIGER